MIRKRQSGLSWHRWGTRRGTDSPSRVCRRRVWLPEGLEERVLLSGMTYTVDQTTDTGAGSGNSGDLRYTITQANDNPGSTIVFAVSGTIALGSELPDLTANVTIEGPGASNLTVEGATGTRVLTIDGVTASISGLTIAGGTAPGGGGGAGGGFLNENGTLTVTGCTFTGNSGGFRGRHRQRRPVDGG